MKTYQLLFILLISFGLPVRAQLLSPQGLTLQGTIIKSNGQPQEGASVAFTIQIRSPKVEDCLLYQETHTLNMTNSGGVFTLIIGSGSRGGPGFQATSTLAQVFNNASGQINSLTCVNGTSFTPVSGDSRKVVITFNDGSGAQTLSDFLSVQAVPYALYADTLQGKEADEFIQVNNSTAAVTQTNLETIFADNTAVTNLQALISGTSTKYVSSSASEGAQLPSFTSGSPPASPTAGDIWYNSTTNTIEYYNGSITQTLGSGGGGETNTASNQGSAGVGVFSAKSGVDLQFKNINAGSNRVVISNDAANKEIDIDISEADLTLGNLGGTLAVAKGGTGSTTALNNNRVMVSSGGNIIEGAAITANRALASSASGIPIASSVTDTELGYLSGVTSAVQTQIDGKQASLGFTPVNKAGDNMTGTLTLPSNGFEVGTNQLVVSGGNVGVGTNSPSTAIDINGAYTQRGIASPGNAPAGQGRIYFDSTSNKFRVSQNNTNYVDLFPTNNLTGSGTSDKIPVFTSSNTLGDSSIQDDGLQVSINKSISLQGTSNSALQISKSTLNSSAVPQTSSSFGLTVSNSYSSSSQPATTGKIVSIEGAAANSNSAVVDTMIAVNARISQFNVGAGTIDKAYAVSGAVSTGTSAMTNAYASFFTVGKSGSGSISNGYGVYVGPVNATNKYSIYASDSAAPSYFAGNVGIGTISSGETLEVAGAIKIGNAAGTADGTIRFTGTDIEARIAGAWVSLSSGGGGGGETNTASNQGAAGVGVFSAKSGVDLQFKNINAGSNKISISDDSGNKEIDIDINEANLSLANFGGTLAVNKGGTGSTTALNNNRVMVSSGGNIVESAAITANRALASSASGIPVASSVTDTELGYLSGVTGAIQTQLDGKQASLGFTPVNKAGDNMTGTLTLPSNGLEVGTNQLVASGGGIGVGRSPIANTKLAVQGAAVSTTNIVATGATIDLSLSNNHLLKSPGTGSVTLQNPVDGGNYTIIISDTTSRTYTFSGCTNQYFSPANNATANRTTYTIMVVLDGANTDCYITWVTGFN